MSSICAQNEAKQNSYCSLHTDKEQLALLHLDVLNKIFTQKKGFTGKTYRDKTYRDKT
jgi:hypothetical protein